MKLNNLKAVKSIDCLLPQPVKCLHPSTSISPLNLPSKDFTVYFCYIPSLTMSMTFNYIIWLGNHILVFTLALNKEFDPVIHHENVDYIINCALKN